MQRKHRPALRYHGGKWILAPWIISHFPKHRIYVEPFGGAMSVLLRKPKSYAEVYNELDEEIVNVFRVYRENGLKLRESLRFTPFSRVEFFEAYRPGKNSLERARRTIIKSFMGFGSDAIKNKSGFRANSNRSGTTPAHDWKNYAEKAEFLIERVRDVVIENKDAKEIIFQHDSTDTLFYIDPPYVHSTRSAKQPKQYKHEMNDEDHRKLAKILQKVKGKVCLSGYPSPLYDELYKDWRKIKKKSLADGARKRIEVLYLNY